MLTRLSISNYALIDSLEIEFQEGFTTITGETGAGKSILLGALSLVLGKRADLSTLKNSDVKCTVEAVMDIKAYDMEDFFSEHDLDHENETFIRREILPSGKSRAFVNDTPVTLNILAALGARLVDIHSQHQTLQLTENAFQFRVLDAVSGNDDLLKSYQGHLGRYTRLSQRLESLKEQKATATKALDYNSFLLKELEEADLNEGVLEALESEYEQLNNVESLMALLSNAHQILNEEQVGVVVALAQLRQLMQKLRDFGADYDNLNERMQAVAIELADLGNELETLSETVEPNPHRLEEVNTQLQQLHHLFQKHNVGDVEALRSIKQELELTVSASLNIDDDIESVEKELKQLKANLLSVGGQIRKNRQQALPDLMLQLNKKVAILGMPSAGFEVELLEADTFRPNGLDDLVFLFRANKGARAGELKKVASGGELSRIMLAIKSILAAHEKLPTLMFDEIDTGVSGEISNKMGDIMKAMGESMQIFAITHLPQVAAKGLQQFKVLKREDGSNTTTHIEKLTEAARIKELAEMLGGRAYTDSAVSHAQQLLFQRS